MSPFALALEPETRYRRSHVVDLDEDLTLPPLPSSPRDYVLPPIVPTLPAMLDLRFHLTSGSVVHFRQPESGERGEALLELLHPDHVFARRHTWKLADASRLTMIPNSDIERIDLRADRLPPWRQGILEEEEVQEVLETSLPAGAASRRPANEPPNLLFCTAELKSGATIRFQRRLRPEFGVNRAYGEPERTALDLDLFLSHLLRGPALFGHGAAGGLFLVNPQHIVRLVTSPGPRETPAGVWPVHFVSDWSE